MVLSCLSFRPRQPFRRPPAPLPPPALAPPALSDDPPAASATADLSLVRSLLPGDTDMMAVLLLRGLPMSIRNLVVLKTSPVLVSAEPVMNGMSIRRPLADI